MTDQVAVGPDGQLLDASKIPWYHDPDDAEPIQPPSTKPSTSSLQEGAMVSPLSFF